LILLPYSSDFCPNVAQNLPEILALKVFWGQLPYLPSPLPRTLIKTGIVWSFHALRPYTLEIFNYVYQPKAKGQQILVKNFIYPANFSRV
jgi:hypothetical protein